jgi:hypothetical protein
LHWIIATDPASEQSLAKLMDAADGSGTRPSELWRHAAPYRGLAAMTEADSDFFFGRDRKTVEVVKALESTPDKLPILLGNSGSANRRWRRLVCWPRSRGKAGRTTLRTPAHGLWHFVTAAGGAF